MDSSSVSSVDKLNMMLSRQNPMNGRAVDVVIERMSEKTASRESKKNELEMNGGRSMLKHKK